MGWSDARNERDRAAGDTSGRSSGGGGQGARDAERRNREAMARGASSSRPSPRESQMNSLSNAIAGKTPGIAPGSAAQRAAQVDSYFSGARGYQNTDFAKAVKDFQDQGFANRALDWFTGIREMNPVDAWNGTSSASWGIDPLTGLTSLAGAAAGAPIGTLYGGLKSLLGWRGPEIAFSGSPTAYSGAGGGSMTGGVNTASGMGGGGWGGRDNQNFLGQGPMEQGRPKFGQATPATPRRPAGPSLPPTGLMDAPGGYLSVPGPTPYGLMTPGYRWPR